MNWQHYRKWSMAIDILPHLKEGDSWRQPALCNCCQGFLLHRVRQPDLLQGFAPQAARCRVANMIVVKEQVRGQKMPTSHWCVVVNGTRLQEWHARYRRIVTDGMAFTMTSYGSLNIPPPCSPRTHTISDHEVIFDGKQEQKAPFDGDTQQLCWY